MEFKTASGIPFYMCERYAECYSYERMYTICNEGEGCYPDRTKCKILENFANFMQLYERAVQEQHKIIAAELKRREWLENYWKNKWVKKQ